MLKKFALSITSLFFTHAVAQTIPPLPGPIEPGAKDIETFICTVSSINEDFMDRSRNLWTTAARGGKFHALSPISLRVKSESAQKAMADVFGFYRKYAAAAYVKSPMYDKGTQRTQEFVVSKCEVDASRATNVALKALSTDAYKLLRTDQEHIFNYLKLNKTAINDEQLASLVSNKPFSTDGFERRDQIQKAATTARIEMKKAPVQNIILEGNFHLGGYDFEKNTFDLSTLKPSAEKYMYEAEQGSMVRLPSYKLTVPAKFLAYKPQSIEEAKKIERARNQSSYMQLKSYIQVTGASYGQGVLINANIARIEVRTREGQLLFTANAQ